MKAAVRSGVCADNGCGSGDAPSWYRVKVVRAIAQCRLHKCIIFILVVTRVNNHIPAWCNQDIRVVWIRKSNNASSEEIPSIWKWTNLLATQGYDQSGVMTHIKFSTLLLQSFLDDFLEVSGDSCISFSQNCLGKFLFGLKLCQQFNTCCWEYSAALLWFLQSSLPGDLL